MVSINKTIKELEVEDEPVIIYSVDNQIKQGYYTPLGPIKLSKNMRRRKLTY